MPDDNRPGGSENFVIPRLRVPITEPVRGHVPTRVRHVAQAVEINIRGSKQMIGKHVRSDVHAENLLLNGGVK
jgi:hypothetical protein